ncbi:hypothetical protein ACFFLM_16505 [Deinococcus oregonensis]|uniref:Uncharacterized protein n=1 Tax=Deinococcus oregonensis TaxID=1805970 RepID=A0ABV6B3W1_9DEIO
MMWRSRLAWAYLAVVALAWALGEWGAEASVPAVGGVHSYPNRTIEN